MLGTLVSVMWLCGPHVALLTDTPLLGGGAMLGQKGGGCRGGAGGEGGGGEGGGGCAGGLGHRQAL